MTKLLITTQVYENYAINSDGTFGVGANAYWKPKGGSEYVVKNVDISDMVDVIAGRASDQIEAYTDGYRELVIGWSVVADDYLTEFERSQLEYDGVIRYPAQVIEVA
jgi:hypothetical protein